MTVLTVDRVRRAFLLPVPGLRGGVASKVLASVATVAVALGLFTVSWDLLANVAVGPYNVKLPSVLFSLAAAASAPVWRARFADVLRIRPLRRIVVVTVVVLAILVLATVVSTRPASGAAQLIAVLTGAILPAVAVVAVVRDVASLRWTLRWFVAGSVVASVFGLYQLTAFYVGWPQLLAPTDAGVDGVTGRIQAFNYEPAYFAVFVVFALAAAAALAKLSGTVLGWVPAAWFAIVLVLANVRALAFLLPVMGVLLAVRWRANRRLLLRLAVAGAVVLLANAGATAGINAALDAASRSAQVADPGGTDLGPGGGVVPGASDGVATDGAGRFDDGGDQPVEVPRHANPPKALLDPNEESSNGPRLDLYKAVLGVVSAHPVLGVGPGVLGTALQRAGYTPPNQTKSVIANNVWLQALADGGAVLLLAELALVVTVALLLRDRAALPVQPLLAAWLAVVIVDGMLTSYFFDVKVWVVLAFILAGTVVLRREPAITLERTPAAR